MNPKSPLYCKRQIHIPSLVIILLAFNLRAYRLGAQALWDDEAFVVLLAREGFRTMLARTLGDTFPRLRAAIAC